MKRMLLIVLLAVTVTFVGLAREKSAKTSPKTSGSVQDQIKKLEEERNQAILHSDTAALDRMTSDDYSLVNGQGRLLKKSEILDGFKSGAIKFESRELSDLDVREYGNTAIVTGKVMQKSTEGGRDTSGENRFTRVYIKEKGRWVSVAQQATPIVQQ